MHPTSLRRGALCAALALAVPPLWAGGIPAHYHVTDLGPMSIASRIAPGGNVAGINAKDFILRPATWNVHGKRHNLANPFQEGIAFGLNDAGVIVGTVGDLVTFRHAAVWHGPDDMLDLGQLLGTRQSSATAINALDDCTVDAQFGRRHQSFLIPGCNGIQNRIDIGSLGGSVTHAVAINDGMEVTGSSDVPGQGTHAFLYTQGAMRDLGVIAGDIASEGAGLNDLGHVVGTSTKNSNEARGFFYDGQAMSPIGTFGGPVSLAFGVNHDDLVVGMADDAQRMSHGFVIDEGRPGSKLVDLNTRLDASGAGLTITQALSINDAGQILANTTLPGNDVFVRFVVLTPAD
jgi:probable HAF family extracellular repeat protein